MTQDKQSSFKSQSAQQIKDEAFRLARHIQIPAQTKQQTKLIAKGIEKGIALYKKQERTKAKDKRRAQKKRNAPTNVTDEVPVQKTISEPQGQSLQAVRSVLVVVGIVFTCFSILHILRYIVGLDLIIGDFSVPLIWSIPFAAVSAALAVWLFLSSRKLG